MKKDNRIKTTHTTPDGVPHATLEDAAAHLAQLDNAGAELALLREALGGTYENDILSAKDWADGTVEIGLSDPADYICINRIRIRAGMARTLANMLNHFADTGRLGLPVPAPADEITPDVLTGLGLKLSDGFWMLGDIEIGRYKIGQFYIVYDQFDPCTLDELKIHVSVMKRPHARTLRVGGIYYRSGGEVVIAPYHEGVARTEDGMEIEHDEIKHYRSVGHVSNSGKVYDDWYFILPREDAPAPAKKWQHDDDPLEYKKVTPDDLLALGFVKYDDGWRLGEIRGKFVSELGNAFYIAHSIRGYGCGYVDSDTLKAYVADIRTRGGVKYEAPAPADEITPHEDSDEITTDHLLALGFTKDNDGDWRLGELRGKFVSRLGNAFYLGVEEYAVGAVGLVKLREIIKQIDATK